MTGRRILVIGFGNPGRLDDGLGPACAEAIRRRAIPGVTVDSNYQLVVEDAVAVAEHNATVFVDAALHGAEPFEWRPVQTPTTSSISSHSLDPGAVVELARSMFGTPFEAWILAIRGYEFDGFGERLSPAAQANLDAAIEFLDSWLRGKVAYPQPAPWPKVVLRSKEMR